MNYQNYRPTGYRFLPVVVKNLLIINFIMWLTTLVLLPKGIDLNDLLGLHYFASEKFKVYQFITYMFMHDLGDYVYTLSISNISYWHILLNMLALWMFGSAVENVWGGKRFLTFYVLTGLGAAVVYYTIVYFKINPEINFLNQCINSDSQSQLFDLLNNEAYKYINPRKYSFTGDLLNFVQSNHPSLNTSISYATQMKIGLLNSPNIIGASGAIYGVLLAFGMLFPNSLVYMFLAIPIKAKYFVVIYGIIELYSGITANENDNVAHWAHLGGLLTGIIVIFVWKNKNRHRSDE